MAMKRSGFGPRTSTLKRSPFSRKGSPFSPDRQQFERNQEAKGRLKSKPKRATAAEGSKYLAACRGEPCFLNVMCPWTEWADPTVVPCHDNRLSAGKGMGLKASHERTLPGCMLCHQWLDQGKASREEKFDAFDQGFARWFLVRARKMGLVEQQELEAA
jgi:hypothetical protein